MRRHEIGSASVKVGMKCEAFVFAAIIGASSFALFERSGLRSAKVRAGRSKALPDVRLS